MNILCCIDRNYLMPLCVTMVSIFENNTNTKISIFVIGKDLTDKEKNIATEIAERYNQSISFYEIDNKQLEKLPNVHGYLTNATYIRLFITEILSADIEKILYLDNDIIVNGNLKELWNTNIENHPCAVVLDSYSYNIEHFNRLQYPMSKGYFNAGVMLINLKYWREHKIIEKAMEFANKYPERIYMADQDIMNYLFQDSKILLPLKFNAICTYFFRKKEVPYEIWNQLKEAQVNPIIIHFTWIKPWFYEGTDHPLAEYFFKYLSLTPWKDIELKYFYKGINHYKYLLKKALGNIGLKKYKDNTYLRKEELI